MKSSGKGFDKVYSISIISKWAITHLLNVNIGRKLRSVLGVILISISPPVPPGENRADRKTRKKGLLTCC